MEQGDTARAREEPEPERKKPEKDHIRAQRSVTKNREIEARVRFIMRRELKAWLELLIRPVKAVCGALHIRSINLTAPVHAPICCSDCSEVARVQAQSDFCGNGRAASACA